jgi:hypothetical protein
MTRAKETLVSSRLLEQAGKLLYAGTKFTGIQKWDAYGHIS